MKIAISAAETSGDLIASALVKSLLELQPDCQIEGLVGDKMIDDEFTVDFQLKTVIENNKP